MGSGAFITIPDDVKSHSPPHWVRQDVKPTGYFSQNNICKIFYMDVRVDLDQDNYGNYEPPDAEDVEDSNDLGLWWVSLYFDDLTPYVRERG